ncbi:MAG: polysaccharide lyase [Halioglobus sp.]|nr:polysaccharide lyase [Halioglobus sp.]
MDKSASLLAVVFVLVSIGGCKIVVNMPNTGSVVTESGAYLCEAGQTCEIDVTDIFFDETFIAKPSGGLLFDKWKFDKARPFDYLCGGSIEPCHFFTSYFEGIDELVALLQSDQKISLRPVFSKTLSPDAVVGWDFVYEDYLSANNPWEYQVVQGEEYPVRRGKRSERFELRPGDCGFNDCERTPPYERSEKAQHLETHSPGEGYWYGLSFYVPDGYRDAGLAPNPPGNACHCINLFQFVDHAVSPENWWPNWMFSKMYGGNFVARTFPTRPDLIRQKHFTLIEAKDFVGRWHDIVIHMNWSESDDGSMRVWVNGVLKLDYSGFTKTPEGKHTYFKYGLYRGGGPTTSPVVYFDEVRRDKRRRNVDIRLIEAED